MKFCLVTSFFGSHSFGGDAVYADLLCRALLRRGHEVHAAFSTRAYEALPDQLPVRFYEPPPGLKLHDLVSGLAGYLSVFRAHQTGRSPRIRESLRRLFSEQQFDVIHVHNLSLLGAMDVCSVMRTQSALRLATMHDYWWACPLSLLWKHDSRVCERPECFTCCLRAGRPPQFWRRGEWFNETLGGMDAVLFPSQSAMEICQGRGVRHDRTYVLPGMLAEGWRSRTEDPPNAGRRYFAAAGRLVREKGFQTLIPCMRQLPDVELRIAGAGPAEGYLRRAARDLPNVRFLGALDHQEIRRLLLGARALLVPSLFPETFGLTAAEALSLGVPVIARRRGSLPELIQATSGGLLYDEEPQLIEHMRTLAWDDGARERLSQAAISALPGIWLEDEHVKEYLRILAECDAARRGGRPA